MGRQDPRDRHGALEEVAAALMRGHIDQPLTVGIIDAESVQGAPIVGPDSRGDARVSAPPGASARSWWAPSACCSLVVLVTGDSVLDPTAVGMWWPSCARRCSGVSVVGADGGYGGTGRVGYGRVVSAGQRRPADSRTMSTGSGTASNTGSAVGMRTPTPVSPKC